jgi:voltage-gated potassium channel Kch
MYFVAESDMETTWAKSFQVSLGPNKTVPISEASVEVKYIASIYWAFTTFTTIGYGDITPSTVPEILFSTLSMVIGAAFFAYAVSNLSSILSGLDRHKAEYEEALQSANEVMHHIHLMPSLRSKIRSYMEYQYSKKNTV